MQHHISAVLDPASIDIISHSPAHTIAIGQAVGELLVPGDLVLLFGTFGAGKTHLTKGLAAAFGVDHRDVTSPTFVIVNEYAGRTASQRLAIHHIDLYRLEGGAADFDSIGLDEMWDSPAICVIEWAERLEGALPAEYLALHLDHLAESKRLLRITPHGAHYSQIVARLRARILGS